MVERKLTQLIREICNEKNIQLEVLSFDWIMQLKKNGKTKHIYGNRFELNSEPAGSIACDKYATYEVLASQHVPVISHVMLYNPETRAYLTTKEQNMKIVKEYWNKCDGKMVVKPNHGQEGIGVTLCNSLKQVQEATNALFERQDDLSLCKFYDIVTEYRCFYLDGEVLLVYGKAKPYVIGDGKNDVAKLLELQSKSTSNSNMKLLDLQYVPQKNEKYYLSWKFNLSGGATPMIVEDGRLKDQIVKLAKLAGSGINARFVTIDIIQTTKGELYVLEINSGVCMSKFIELTPNGKAIAKGIYSKAIDKMLE